MPMVGATVEFARQTTLLLLRNRLLWLLLLAQIGIAAIVYVRGIQPPRDMSGRQLYCAMSWWLLGSVSLPWTTMYFAVQAVHGDIEDRTLQYLLVRPVPRASILLGKWVATSAIAAVVHVFGAALAFAAAAAHPHLWAEGPESSLLGVFATAMVLLAVAYAAVGAWLSAMFKKPLVWSAAFIVGGQMFLANLPARAGIRLATIADPVRRFVLSAIDPDRRLARIMWPSEPDWRGELVGRPILNLTILVAVALVLALVSYQRTEYDSRERE